MEIMEITFNENHLRAILRIGDTKSFLGGCSLEEIKRLEKEGFKVEVFNQDVVETDVTRLR
jgi:hypothetical protein